MSYKRQIANPSYSKPYVHYSQDPDPENPNERKAHPDAADRALWEDRDRIGIVYLLHTADPLSPNHPGQHYIGFAEIRDGDADLTAALDRRIRTHAEDPDARYMQVLKERGISFSIAATWENETRNFERKLKNRHGANKFCPICQGMRQFVQWDSQVAQPLDKRNYQKKTRVLSE